MKINLEVYVRTAVRMVMISKAACHACVFVLGLGLGKALSQYALVVFYFKYNCFVKLLIINTIQLTLNDFSNFHYSIICRYPATNIH